MLARRFLSADAGAAAAVEAVGLFELVGAEEGVADRLRRFVGVGVGVSSSVDAVRSSDCCCCSMERAVWRFRPRLPDAGTEVATGWACA